MLGQVLLGKYKVTRLLDQGGMSKIFLARHADRDVVVKVLKETLRPQIKAVEHFRREIHIMSRFQHPNAVAYLDSAPSDRAHGPILVMEYLRGVDLVTLLERERRLSAERTGRLLAQLCDVLQAAHDAGIVHRDLKPGNLMLLYPGTPQETLKLMDFGLAKMSALLYISPDEVFDWRLPAASGTPEYISPEQVRGQDADLRGDLYSVGVLLFEMLTGRRPFEQAGVEDLLLAHLDQAPPAFAERGLAGPVPPGLEAVVRGCLSKCPDQRPASARALFEAYERALGRRLAAFRPGASASGLRPALPARPGAAGPTGSGVRPPVDRNAVRHEMEACMPEAMAMLKIKGFISDLGGEVVESVPGMIRVRLADPAAERKSRGLFGWMGSGSARQTTLEAATDVELHMERRDPSQTSRLTITLVLRPGNGLATPDWRNRCNQIGRDLQAYLMGR